MIRSTHRTHGLSCNVSGYKCNKHAINNIRYTSTREATSDSLTDDKLALNLFHCSRSRKRHIALLKQTRYLSVS